MTLAELRFAKKLLDQGVPLEAATLRRILEHALALADPTPHAPAPSASRRNGAKR